jgi:hypothetical protein
MTVVLLHEAQSGLVIFSPVLTSKRLAEAIENQWQPGSVIETNGDYETASSLNYYTRRQVRMLNGQCNNIWYGSTFPDAPGAFDDDASFEKLWRSQQRVFLLTGEDAKPGGARNSDCPQNKRLPSYINRDACVAAKGGGKLVLTNAPKPCPGPAWPR